MSGDIERWQEFTPAEQTAERLAWFAVAVREAIPSMGDADLEAVEVVLRAVAARLRQLGVSAAEAERSRLIALRRLGELLGPAPKPGIDVGKGRPIVSSPDETKPISAAESNRRYLARSLASPGNATLVDTELAGKTPPSPSRMLKLIQRERSTANIPMPARRYAVLLADPPWRYDANKCGSRAVENHYPTMSLDAIRALQVPAAPDSMLFLWATPPLLPEALAVMAAWGFTYRTSAVWVKDKIGMGYYFRQQHELLLIGKRGDLPAPRPEDRAPSLLAGARARHSEKPASAYEAIEAMYPWALGDPPEICELFQRRPRKGWDGWGNEAGGDD